MTAPPPGPYGPPPEGQPPYGPYGPPQYGQPQYGQPQYGQPQYGQPQYGQPEFGQPQYGPPPPGQPPKGNRTPLIVAAAVVVLVAIGVTLFLVLRGGDDNGPLAAGPSGSPTVAASSRPANTGRASASAPAAGSSAAPDLAVLRTQVTTLYIGLSSAYKQAASTHDPSVVGAYIAAHNNSSLGYTAAECNASTTELSDPYVFLPNLSSLRPDPAFSKIVKGRYAGRPVAGTAYALSLTTDSVKGQTATSTVHVAVGSDEHVTFFFDCE